MVHHQGDISLILLKSILFGFLSLIVVSAILIAIAIEFVLPALATSFGGFGISPS